MSFDYEKLDFLCATFMELGLSLLGVEYKDGIKFVVYAKQIYN